MPTITEFLDARIAEDEAAAKAAEVASSQALDISNEPIGPRWEDGDGMVFGQRDKNGYRIPLWDNEGSWTLSVDPKVSAHIALHDPARVLAECAAKQRIVDLHSPVKDEGWLSGEDHGYLWCESCGSLDDSPEAYPCDTAKALAAVYKDHQDYRQEWDRG